jgi:hypothetical protein
MPRTSNACDRCKIKKDRCDANNPCKTCYKYKTICTRTPNKKRGPPAKKKETKISKYRKIDNLLNK